ncbi:expressed unknown protein [Seminavis robusta]|uniref:Uncharacterized protein n=1 Tax=Seminavis robusta TaxID=568900 RepID=A0A9N8HG66_9STRA|nr:expressed unknown protein [Seminavis robusta]|eukprot:Sro615_g175860.1 n/a (219) ;mRNA; f:49471-50127
MLKSSNKAREIGRNVRTALGKNSKGLATSLQRPHPTGEGMEICDTQTSLVDASIDEATARFTRATDISPFMTDPLLSEVGPMAELPGADEILAGTFECPPETDQYTQLLIQHLATPPEVMAAGDIPLDIPLKEHQRAWKQQNHHTAADPRNLSFAHHKAGAHDKSISQVDTTIRSAPIQAGFSPPSWEFMSDCSIPKKANNLLASAMRIIVLMAPSST